MNVIRGSFKQLSSFPFNLYGVLSWPVATKRGGRHDRLMDEKEQLYQPFNNELGCIYQ